MIPRKPDHNVGNICSTNLIATAIFVIVSTILRLILILSTQLLYLYCLYIYIYTIYCNTRLIYWYTIDINWWSSKEWEWCWRPVFTRNCVAKRLMLSIYPSWNMEVVIFLLSFNSSLTIHPISTQPLSSDRNPSAMVLLSKLWPFSNSWLVSAWSHWKATSDGFGSKTLPTLSSHVQALFLKAFSSARKYLSSRNLATTLGNLWTASSNICSSYSSLSSSA